MPPLSRHSRNGSVIGPMTWPSGTSHLADAQVRQTLRTAEGQPVGALNQRAAPLLSYGLSPDEHFAQALHRGRDLLPTELPAVLDLDPLVFAADCRAQQRGRLRDLRRTAVGALRELTRRWCAVGRRLRQFQHASLQATTASRDLGFRGVTDSVNLLARYYVSVSLMGSLRWAMHHAMASPLTTC